MEASDPGREVSRRRIVGLALIWLGVFVSLGVLLWLTIGHGLGGSLAGRRFELPRAQVEARLDRQGVLHVTERITFDFHGSFSGAYRDIETPHGMRVENVTLSEGGVAYEPGGGTELGVDDHPGTFGTRNDYTKTRVVWHHRSEDQPRTFELRYELHGLVRRHRQVADANWQVWGDEWAQPLRHLTVSLQLPPAAAGKTRAYGHFVRADGRVATDGRTVRLEARNVPANEFVELRLALPSNAVAPAKTLSVGGAAVTPSAAAGTGPTSATAGVTAASIAAEERGYAATYAEARRIPGLLADASPWLIPLLLGLSFAPGSLVLMWAYRRHGREHDVDDLDLPAHQVEPPDDLPPALASQLAGQDERASRHAFVATVFDLIRRGRYRTVPAQTGPDGSTVDIALLPGDESVELHKWEVPVVRILDRVIRPDVPVALGDLKEELARHRSKGAADFDRFRKALKRESRTWFTSGGRRPVEISMYLLLLAAVPLLIWEPVAFVEASYVRIALVLALAGNALALLLGFSQQALWVRRTREAQRRALPWLGFRRYLRTHAGLDDEHPAALPLWERYLTYGIAFGVADLILERVQPVLERDGAAGSSDVLAMAHFWMPDYGSLTGAFEAGTSTASSSGGGGYSGGSFGGGGGGGGGGAW